MLAGCATDNSPSFEKIGYVGVSANISELEPDTSASTIFSLAESQSDGMGFILGLDVTEKLSAELRYTDLGSATLAPLASIDYQEASASVLYYPLGDARAPEIRSGFTAFVRGGVNLMVHESEIELDAEDNYQFLAGVGVDYLFSDRLAVRAEANFHDVDAKALHLGLLYRFGSQPVSGPQYVGQRQQRERPTPQQPTIAGPIPQQPTIARPAPQQPVSTPEIASVPQPQIAQRPVQQQPQIVQQPGRQPVTTTAPEQESTTGFRLVNGDLNGVQFAAGSARLDERAFRVLDSLAAELRQRPSVSLELQVHTNGTPGSRPALSLSRARALVVGRLLLSRGVNQNQLSARAFGANQPRVSGDPVANERIELRVSGI